MFRDYPDREAVVMACLDVKNRIIATSLVSVGTVSTSLVHPREVFKAAIICNASKVILAHNHPSGELTPSPDDIEATRRIDEAGNILGIPLLDHVIITEDGHASMSEAGHLAA